MLLFFLMIVCAQAKTFVETESGVSLDVALQDQTTDIIGLYLAQILDTTTVLAATNKDDMTVNIETTGYTPLVGNFLCMQEVGKITQEEITSVSSIGVNQYTLALAVPLDFAYTTAGGCSVQNVNMEVDGSTTSAIFQVGPQGNYQWDITRMLIQMNLDSQGDDGEFGDIDALDNGVYFRKEDSILSQNIFNAKENSDFAIEGYDVTYVIRSGGQGTHGMRARITFSGSDKRGVVIRLDGSTGDNFRAVVRDDLTDLVRFRVRVQGHIVDP